MNHIRMQRLVSGALQEAANAAQAIMDDALPLHGASLRTTMLIELIPDDLGEADAPPMITVSGNKEVDEKDVRKTIESALKLCDRIKSGDDTVLSFSSTDTHGGKDVFGWN